jgi:5-methylcytosine-specific restriction endonuclease McrA
MAKASLEHLPSTRKDAKGLGIRHYFTGKECSRGHVEKRISSTGTCLRCAAENSSRARNLNPEGHRKASRHWREMNPEKALSATLAWRAANSERYHEASRKNARAWQIANPEKSRDNSRISQRNRNARKHNAEGAHTAADIARIRKSQKDRCGYCRVKLSSGGHIDHIIALAKGGANSSRNLQLLCEPCNKSKSARDPISFAQSRGMLL